MCRQVAEASLRGSRVHATLAMVPRFEVGGDGYHWLTDHLFLGRGRLAGSGWIEYEIVRFA